ncbi:MAG: PAS-domain containing protein [Pseudomonadota bacterium]|nr:PAS-domain containing protein [Pseudomonadota bacterium]MEC8315293.1 PAS-domain containing protein [Pseudomonadota bacterium]|tara:strand:- start:6402 stop:8366 length:1965 start_codon:yes stop_codon:yes gene_type:complete
MKFRDSMNDYILDMYNISDMIFMLLLSLLVACIIIHQKKKSYPFTNSFKYIIEAFFIYVFDIRFAKKIQEDKYKIQTSNKICWVIKNGKIVEFNKNYENLHNGKTISEIIRQNIHIFPIEDLKNIDDGKTKIKKILNGKQYTFILKSENKDDSIIITAEDKTKEDTQNQLLDKQNETNLQLMNRLNSPVAIFGQDQSLVFFNSAFESFSMLTYEYLNNKPTESEILDSMRQKEILPYQANFQEWKKKQLNIYETLNDREQWWYLQDGRTLRLLSQPNPMGGVTHIFENHTERLALENEAKLLSEIQKQTIDSLSEGIVLFGIDGKIKLHNPKFTELWQIEDSLVGMHVRSFMKIIEKSEILDEIYTNIVSSGVDRREHSNILNCENNKIIYYQSSILPDRSILYTFTDITDSKKIEEALIEKNSALAQADNIKTSFMNNISHELRAPLQNIIGFSELIEETHNNSVMDQQISDYIKDIKKSGNELHHQINQILEITALESGNIESEYQKINGNEIIEIFQDELNKLDFFNIDYDVVGNAIDDSKFMNIDVTHISRLFTGVVRLVDRHMSSDDIKKCKIKIDIKSDQKSSKFILKFDEISQNLFKDINNLNREFTYVPGSIENIIIDKYVMFFSGKINIEPKEDNITIEIPAIQL